MPDVFSEWLTQRLSMRGLSIRQFAIQVGVTPEAAGYWLSGERTPRKRYLPQIADVLGVSPSEVTRLWSGMVNGDTKILRTGDMVTLRGPDGKPLLVTDKILKQLELEAEFGQDVSQPEKV